MIIITDNGPIDVGEDPTPSAPRTPRPHSVFTWTSPDGTTIWDLCGRGPVTLLSGARGFGMPTPQHWRRENLGDGAAHYGLRYPAREAYLPVRVRSTDILDQERLFFASLNPATQGRLRVTTPDARWRELVLRYDDGAEGEYVTDPVMEGATRYGLRLTAEDPFWQGQPIVERFEYPAATPSFFTGPPFRLAPSEVLGRSRLTNPGDVNAYAVWRVEGPFTGFSVGIGDALVTMSLTRGAGRWVEIDMNPAAKTIRDDTGANLWGNADKVAMEPLPPGEVVIKTTVLGAAEGSAVQVSFTPRHYRAW